MKLQFNIEIWGKLRIITNDQYHNYLLNCAQFCWQKVCRTNDLFHAATHGSKIPRPHSRDIHQIYLQWTNKILSWYFSQSHDNTLICHSDPVMPHHWSSHWPEVSSDLDKMGHHHLIPDWVAALCLSGELLSHRAVAGIDNLVHGLRLYPVTRQRLGDVNNCHALTTLLHKVIFSAKSKSE